MCHRLSRETDALRRAYILYTDEEKKPGHHMSVYLCVCVSLEPELWIYSLSWYIIEYDRYECHRRCGRRHEANVAPIDTLHSRIYQTRLKSSRTTDREATHKRNGLR